MDDLPAPLASRVQAELRSGERLVWTGQPVPTRFARPAIGLVLFGIPWTAFAVFWIVMASGMMFGGIGLAGNGFFACFPLFGIPFVLIGIGLLTSPLWMRRKARQTVYALTDRRAIIWAAGWFGGVEVRSYTGEGLGKMVRRDYPDGTGDLVFEEVVSVGRDSDGYMRTRRTERGFIAIREVREVEELVRRTLLPAG
jgi:hypothetical protein